MGEQPPFAGLGKLYFCRVGDKEPQPLGEAVALKPGMLTYKDDEPESEYGAKGYSIGFNATVQEWLSPDNADVVAEVVRRFKEKTTE